MCSIVKDFLKDRRSFLAGIFLSVIMWFFIFISDYLIFLSLDYKISFFAIIIVVTLSYAISDFSMIPGGVAVTEALMISLYVSFGIPASIALVISILSRGFYYFINLLIGGVSLIYLQVIYK